MNISKYLENIREETGTFVWGGKIYNTVDYFYACDMEGERPLLSAGNVTVVCAGRRKNVFIKRFAGELTEPVHDLEYWEKYNIDSTDYIPVIIDLASFSNTAESWDFNSIITQAIEKYSNAETAEEIIGSGKLALLLVNCVLIDRYNHMDDYKAEQFINRLSYYCRDSGNGAMIVTDHQPIFSYDIEKNNMIVLNPVGDISKWLENIVRRKGRDIYYSRRLRSFYDDPLIKDIIKTPYDLLSVMQFCDELKFDEDDTRWIDVADYGIYDYIKGVRFCGLNPATIINRILMDNLGYEEAVYNDFISIVSYLVLKDGSNRGNIITTETLPKITDIDYDNIVLFTNEFLYTATDETVFHKLVKIRNEYGKTAKIKKAYLGEMDKLNEQLLKESVDGRTWFKNNVAVADSPDTRGMILHMLAKCRNDRVALNVLKILVALYKLLKDDTSILLNENLQITDFPKWFQFLFKLMEKDWCPDFIFDFDFIEDGISKTPAHFIISCREFLTAKRVLRLESVDIYSFIWEEYINKEKMIDDTLLLTLSMLDKKELNSDKMRDIMIEFSSVFAGNLLEGETHKDRRREFWKKIVSWPSLQSVSIAEAFISEMFRNSDYEPAEKDNDFLHMAIWREKRELYNRAMFSCVSYSHNEYTRAIKKLYKANPLEYGIVYSEVNSYNL